MLISLTIRDPESFVEKIDHNLTWLPQLLKLSTLTKCHVLHAIMSLFVITKLHAHGA